VNACGAPLSCSRGQVDSSLRSVFLAITWYMVPQAPSAPPGYRGLEEGPPAAARNAPRPSPTAHPGSVRVRQEVPLRVGTAARKGRSFPLLPLWVPDAGPRRHHRSLAGPENPPSPHQDRRGSPGARRRFPGSNLLPLSVPGELISPTLPAPPVALSLLPSGPNSSLAFREASV
jgi:hypothetical protein